MLCCAVLSQEGQLRLTKTLNVQTPTPILEFPLTATSTTTAAVTPATLRSSSTSSPGRRASGSSPAAAAGGIKKRPIQCRRCGGFRMECGGLNVLMIAAQKLHAGILSRVLAAAPNVNINATNERGALPPACSSAVQLYPCPLPRPFLTGLNHMHVRGLASFVCMLPLSLCCMSCVARCRCVQA